MNSNNNGEKTILLCLICAGRARQKNVFAREEEAIGNRGGVFIRKMGMGRIDITLIEERGTLIISRMRKRSILILTTPSS